MKVILFLLLTFQLIAIVQAQASGEGSAGGSASGNASAGGGDNSVLPTASSDPITPSGSSQSPAGSSQQPAQSNSPTSNDPLPATSKQEETPTSTPENTPSSTPSDNNNNNNSNSNNNNNTFSRSSGRTRSSNNNSSQGSNPTNSPSDNGSTDNNNGDNSNSGSNNNQGQHQNQSGSQDNVGTIAGGVVGGVVGLALIGGLLTWLNRRGGCTSRTKRRNHDTFDDFAMNMKDPESATMGGGGAAPDMTAATTSAGATGGMSPVSPFQRRMAPIAPQTTGYMNLGNDEFSETSTAVPLMNQDMTGYPSAGAGINQHGQPVDPYYGYGNSDYKTQLYHQNNGGMDHWQQQQQPDHQQYYGAPITSPQLSNQPEHHQMKPDTIEYKPHEV